MGSPPRQTRQAAGWTLALMYSLGERNPGRLWGGALTRYLDSRLEIDNNPAERAIPTIAIGLKDFRCIATRYAKLAANFAATVLIAAIVLWWWLV